MRGLNVLSLFDGVGTGFYSLEQAGFKINRYYASEIEEKAIQISRFHHPEIIQLGDIELWKEWDIDWSNIDLILGASPCQGFSYSGKLLNFQDPRSALFFTFTDILNHTKKYNSNLKFLLENVKMRKEWESVISSYLEVKPVLINSAKLSAQNRQRLYWANWKITQPEEKNLTWQDVRENEYPEFFFTEKALKLFPQFKIKNSSSENKAVFNFPIEKECIGAMRGRYLVNGKRWDDPEGLKGKTKQYIEFRHDGKSNALTTVQKDGIVVPFTLPNRVLVEEFFYRYKTPVECERLQTFPDNFTKYGINNKGEVTEIPKGLATKHWETDGQPM